MRTLIFFKWFCANLMINTREWLKINWFFNFLSLSHLVYLCPLLSTRFSVESRSEIRQLLVGGSGGGSNFVSCNFCVRCVSRRCQLIYIVAILTIATIIQIFTHIRLPATIMAQHGWKWCVAIQCNRSYIIVWHHL